MCAHNKPEERTCEDGLVWNDDINNCDQDKGAEDPAGIEIKLKRLVMPLSSLQRPLWK